MDGPQRMKLDDTQKCVGGQKGRKVDGLCYMQISIIARVTALHCYLALNFSEIIKMKYKIMKKCPNFMTLTWVNYSKTLSKFSVKL